MGVQLAKPSLLFTLFLRFIYHRVFQRERNLQGNSTFLPSQVKEQQESKLVRRFVDNISERTVRCSFTPQFQPLLNFGINFVSIWLQPLTAMYRVLQSTFGCRMSTWALPVALVSVQITESSVATLRCGSASYHSIKLDREKKNHFQLIQKSSHNSPYE